MYLENRYGRTQWSVVTKTKMVQIYEYETFKVLGKDSPPPVVYKNIRFRLVYDDKHDVYHKARLVSDVHTTDIPV